MAQLLHFGAPVNHAAASGDLAARRACGRGGDRDDELLVALEMKGVNVLCAFVGRGCDGADDEGASFGGVFRR